MESWDHVKIPNCVNKNSELQTPCIVFQRHHYLEINTGLIECQVQYHLYEISTWVLI